MSITCSQVDSIFRRLWASDELYIMDRSYVRIHILVYTAAMYFVIPFLGIIIQFVI